MGTVVKSEGLGKMYLLRHQKEEPYTALRDVLSASMKRFGRRCLRLFTSPQHASTSREEFWALKDVSFEVSEGQRIGIIGRNGAGKSTLLKILSRITRPTTGRAYIRGRVASLLEVGTGFHPELTGRENIFLSGAILGMSRSEIVSKFDEIVAFAEIEQFLDTPVKRYSSGMYVRLAFAVAAHLDTDILIVDEVLAVGDAQFQQKCLGKMGDVAKEGRTLLFVSHNMASIIRLCRRAMWLDKGRLQMFGPTEKVVSDYLSVGSEAEGEHRWHNIIEAPGNKKIRLRAVRVLNSDRVVTATIDARFSFYVEIEYEIMMHLPNMRVGFRLVTSSGIIVFDTRDTADHTWRGQGRHPGTYVSTCEIPGMLLNSETYVLTVGSDIPFVETLFYEESVLRFHVEQTGILSVHDAERVPGVICPSLSWHVLRLTG